MSRGKKLTKAEKQRRREQRERQVDHEVLGLHRDIEDLSRSDTAALNLAGPCEDRLADLQIDADLIEATLQLWRRAAPDHPLTTTLDQLAAEYRRHHEVLSGLATQLMSNSQPASEDEVHRIEPTALEKTAIATAILGADMGRDIPF